MRIQIHELFSLNPVKWVKPYGYFFILKLRLKYMSTQLIRVIYQYNYRDYGYDKTCMFYFHVIENCKQLYWFYIFSQQKLILIVFEERQTKTWLQNLHSLVLLSLPHIPSLDDAHIYLACSSNHRLQNNKTI